ncbi:MAG: PAS domain S-box protein [Ignavibacteriales bacterium]
MTAARIMVVEDEFIIGLDIRKKLIDLGYDVVALVNGPDACLNKLREVQPDLILMDIMLKNSMDGIETAEKVKELYNIPVVYLTAFADEKTLERAKLTEPYGYIIKPFEVRELQSTLEVALYKYKMEARLLESELKYRTLILTATDAVLTLDNEGFITSCNNKTISMFLYEHDELIGMPVKQLLPAVIINHLAEGMKRFLQVGKPIIGDIVELAAKDKNQRNFPVELSFSQWKVKDVEYFTFIIRDITRRKEIENALRSAHNELEKRVELRTAELNALVHQSPYPICVFNLEGKPVLVNSALFELWSGHSEDFIGNYSLFQDPLVQDEKSSTILRKIFQEGGEYKTQPMYLDQEMYPMLKSREGRVLVFHFYSVVDDTGKVFRVVNLIEDITEREKARDISLELKEQKDRSAIILQKLEEERTRISRELHDSIGQILSAVKFNLEIFEKTESSGNKHISTARELITKTGVELKKIIYSLHPTALDHYGLIPALNQLCGEFRTNSSVGLDFYTNGEQCSRQDKLDKKTELYIYRIVQEALNNSLKHSQCTKAEVIVNFTHDSLMVTVRDNGVGFDYTGDTRNHTGNPVFGIINMKERAEALNGDFQLCTSPGNGTEITIIIPV